MPWTVRIFAVAALIGAPMAFSEPPTPTPVPTTLPATTQPADSLDQAMEDFIVWYGQLGATLQGVTDKPSAEAAAKTLEDAPAQSRALFGRSLGMMAQLQDAEAQAALQKKFGARVQQVVANLQAQEQRLYRDPELRAIIAPKLAAALAVFTSRPASRPATRPNDPQ